MYAMAERGFNIPRRLARGKMPICEYPQISLGASQITHNSQGLVEHKNILGLF